MNTSHRPEVLLVLNKDSEYRPCALIHAIPASPFKYDVA